MRIGAFPNFSPRELPGLQQASELSAGGGATKTAGAGGAKGGQFSSLLDNAVSEVDSKMHAAETEKGKLLTGEAGNVHQAVIAMQEASVAFSLMVEVRNKLVESYQELMRMQV